MRRKAAYCRITVLTVSDLCLKLDFYGTVTRAARNGVSHGKPNSDSLPLHRFSCFTLGPSPLDLQVWVAFLARLAGQPPFEELDVALLQMTDITDRRTPGRLCYGASGMPYGGFGILRQNGKAAPSVGAASPVRLFPSIVSQPRSPTLATLASLQRRHSLHTRAYMYSSISQILLHELLSLMLILLRTRACRYFPWRWPLSCLWLRPRQLQLMLPHMHRSPSWSGNAMMSAKTTATRTCRRSASMCLTRRT